MFDVVPHEHASRCHGAGFDELKLNPTLKTAGDAGTPPPSSTGWMENGVSSTTPASMSALAQLTTPHDQDVPARLGFQPAYEIRCIVTDERDQTSWLNASGVNFPLW